MIHSIRLSAYCLLIFLILTTSCKRDVSDSEQGLSEKLIQYVNPFIGTKNMGHTFPGAAVPFGMVQLSPETNQQPMFKEGEYNTETYQYCSGYQYKDSTIFGFSHTHFSGTGHADLGDFLLMPTTGVLRLTPGEAGMPGSGYHSAFSHHTEGAEPAYYKVFLDDYKISAELTATERVGFHQYTFPETDSAHLILDLTSNIYNYEGKNVWTFLRVENDTLITGYRQTQGWARTRTVYFAMTFSKAFTTYGHKKFDNTPYKGFYRRFNEEENFPEMAGKDITAYFNFNTEAHEKIKIKFALSAVSTAGALQNLMAEIPGWDFEAVKTASQQKWEQELSKIRVETRTQAQLETFYTALYHTMLSPVIYEDVDGSYRGLDQNIHTSEGFTNYTIFSLWDTYRALHPLFNIIQPARNRDMIRSMLAHYDQSVHHMLPVWSHYSNENWCMIGIHSVSVIADAVAKGNTDFDLEHALLACINSSNCSYYDGIDALRSKGYVPEDISPYSVSKTLEFSYDDWCIAQLAEHMNNKEVTDRFMQRAQNFNHVYAPKLGFMRPKLSDGSWKTPFDPMDTHGQGFIEGNAWTYSLFVPHQVDDLIGLMGGDERFTSHLDSLFSMQLDDKYIEKNEDITRDGIIGNYVHGNEPGHHIPYLYNWTNSPWKTQERVRMIMDSMYGNTVDGLCGNDDAGQMSAWYIFSALGFYPVCPGSNQYAIGSPLVENAVLHFENGNTLTIKVSKQGPNNIYVQKVLVNGEEINRPYLTHEEVINGGIIHFILGSSPNIQ